MAAQQTNFLKNLAILGGTLLLFVTGPGRFSIDRILSKTALTAPADRQFHSSLLARRAPCASASSFAHMIDGWTRR